MLISLQTLFTYFVTSLFHKKSEFLIFLKDIPNLQYQDFFIKGGSNCSFEIKTEIILLRNCAHRVAKTVYKKEFCVLIVAILYLIQGVNPNTMLINGTGIHVYIYSRVMSLEGVLQDKNVKT